MSQLDWPGQRRVPYDEFIAALAELLQEVREDKAIPILLSIPRAPSAPFDPVADVYQSGAITVAGWSNTLVVDGRNALVRSVSEEDIPAGDMFHDDRGFSECGHLAIAQALADEILARYVSRR